MTEQLRVLIVDDHPVFRDGLRAALSVDADATVVGEASTGRQAVELAASLRPRLIVMDIQMPDMNGIEATRKIVEASPHTNVLIVRCSKTTRQYSRRCALGARGYVLKGVRSAELLRAMRAVGSGEAVFSPAIVARLTEYFGAMRGATPARLFPELTEREREILELVARGLKNAEIAQRLYLNPKTVRNHISSIFDKLQLVDRGQAIVRAREAGLG